jgi:hypothetical protein
MHNTHRGHGEKKLEFACCCCCCCNKSDVRVRKLKRAKQANEWREVAESWHRFFARFPLKRSNKYHARKYLSLFSPRLIIKSTRYEARAKVFACYSTAKKYTLSSYRQVYMNGVCVGSRTFHLPGAHLTRLQLSLLLAFFFHWIHNFSSFLAGNEHAGEFPKFKVEILTEREISSFSIVIQILTEWEWPHTVARREYKIMVFSYTI